MTKWNNLTQIYNLFVNIRLSCSFIILGNWFNFYDVNMTTTHLYDLAQTP